jgi:predicted Zn-dependent peptidase
MKNSIEIWNLSNGIRVVSENIKKSLSVYVSIVANVGTRDEFPEENGIAHLFEHMAFKGTQKRKPWHILNAIDSVGGEINAFTTREKTCFYTYTSKPYLKKSIDLLTDIVFHSNFPYEELVKEKQVIYDEINMYKDMPEESIFDDFEELLFPDHSLGLPILGSQSTLENITEINLRNFREKNYSASNLVICVIGNFRKDLLELYCKNFLENLNLSKEQKHRETVKKNQYFEKNLVKKFKQAHLILGGIGCSYHSDDFYPFSLLIHYLGGDTMNNLLNLNIREKYGICYNIHSFFVPYQDTGIWGIYAGFDDSNYKKLKKLIYKELSKLINDGISVQKLQRIKKQFIGHLILSNENNFNKMQRYAKNLLDFQKIIPLEETIEQIQKINKEQIQEIARKYFDLSNLSQLTYFPAV